MKYTNKYGSYISSKISKTNGVETIADSDGVLWLNKKHVEEGLDHINLQKTTLKYLLDHRKHRYKLVDK